MALGGGMSLTYYDKEPYMTIRIELTAQDLIRNRSKEDLEMLLRDRGRIEYLAEEVE